MGSKISLSPASPLDRDTLAGRPHTDSGNGSSLVRHTPATVATIATLIEPLTSTGLAWVLFGEQLGALSILGGLLLLGAIGLLYLASARRTPIAAQPVPAD